MRIYVTIIITSITDRPIVFAATLVVSASSTFKTAIILYLSSLLTIVDCKGYIHISTNNSSLSLLLESPGHWGKWTLPLQTFLCMYMIVWLILCCVFVFFCPRLVYFMLPVAVDCQFLIDLSVFSNGYYLIIYLLLFLLVNHNCVIVWYL